MENQKKLCVDCKYYIWNFEVSYLPGHLCSRNGNTTNMITGEETTDWLYCEYERKDYYETQCGTVGRFFEGKE